VKGVFEQLAIGLPPRFDSIGQHDGDSGGYHGMMNAVEDFRVHPCGVRAEAFEWCGHHAILAGDRYEIGENSQPEVLVMIYDTVKRRSSSRII